MRKIITIGREFGSGGRELGRRLAEELGIAYYDQEIVTEISKRTDPSEQYVQRIMESRPVVSFPIHVGMSFHPVSSANMDQSYAIYREQCNILKEMAEASDCVIVGRCADYILREMNPFRIFVYADMDSKVKRCRMKAPENEKFTDKELRRHIQEIDKNRAQYYSYYTDRQWGDKLNYDLCVNTTNASIKDIVPYIAKMF